MRENQASALILLEQNIQVWKKLVHTTCSTICLLTDRLASRQQLSQNFLTITIVNAQLPENSHS